MGRRLLLPLLVALLLAPAPGCGYQLRGIDGAAPGFHGLRLQIPQSEPGFAFLLRRSLETAGITPHAAADPAAQAYPLLSIGGETFSGRPASTTVLARAAQVTLRLSLRIQLVAGGQTLIDGENLSVERTYYQDLRNIAGNREEAELLRSEMRQELAEQILRRIEAASR